MGKVKDTSYFVVQGWMLNQLLLKGNALQVFAIIHGFSHAEGNEFAGSLQYLCEFTGASRSTVMRSLTELQNLGLIVKREIYENGVKFNRYKAVENITVSYDTPGVKMTPPPFQNDTTPGVKMTPPPFQNDTTPGVKMTPHIIEENNIGDNIENNIENKNKGKRTPAFVPPTLQEVEEYAKSRNSSVDPKRFWDYFDAGDWKDSEGKPVKSWKQKFITWESKQDPPKSERGVAENNGANDVQRTYAKSQLNVTRL